jgi:hypothetical protein
VRLSLVGSLALLGLFGCGRTGWHEAREPWRHDAEVSCLKAGAVREGPGIVQIKPISGPGMCGADFPLKVSALGGGTALGFADEQRPPGGIPQYVSAPPRAPYTPPPASYPQDTYAGPVPYPAPDSIARAPEGPMTIHGPGIDNPENDTDDFEDTVPPAAGPQGPYAPPPQSAEPLPPLGPPRAPHVANAAAVTPAATLACPMVSAVDQWIANAVQPAAERWFGQPVVAIHQISAYSCRGMNGQRNARISEHAFGNALDVESFILADGRKVTVQHGWRGLPEERGFLHDVHAAACRQFTTVLGPGSNAFHYNHLHLDLMRRSGGRGICNPAAIPGDAVAGRRGFPAISSVTEAHAPRLGFAPEPQGHDNPLAGLPDDRPAAVAGED